MEGTLSAADQSSITSSPGHDAVCLTNDELAARITELAGHLNVANHRLLVMIAEFDRRAGWSDGVTKSCAHWLNVHCGIGLGTARERLRVAHALESLPKISDAMARGQLSYAKVRAITRVADAENEALLLQLALNETAHHVEKLVMQYREGRESAEISREARQQAHRALHLIWERDGSLVVRARLPAETGALVMRALDSVVEQVLPSSDFSTPTSDDVPAATINADVSAGTRNADVLAGNTHASVPAGSADAHIPAGTSGAPRRDGDLLDAPVQTDAPSWSMRRADALVVIAESFLAHGVKAMAGGDRQQIVVHVDAQTLINGTPGRCELDEGPSMSAETARRLACDSSLLAVVEDDKGEPLDVGRKTRAIPPALRRALAARDRGCRAPGCTHTRFVDGHHIRHWADGGETKLANLVTLCRFHHRAVHEGRLIVERLDDGAWRFSKTDGKSLTAVLPERTRPLELAATFPREPIAGGLRGSKC
jgi:hypothetical protein